MSQLLGYYELYLSTGRPMWREDVLSRADYLTRHGDEIVAFSSFDGMLALALLDAYELSGDTYHFDSANRIVARLKSLTGSAATLNWGAMAAMALAKHFDLTGDPVSLAKAREIVHSLPAFQNPDGGFPHVCRESRDIHYTAWLGMELLMIRRFIRDPLIDAMLEGIRGFLRDKVAPDGRTQYRLCALCCGDSDRDGVQDDSDQCPSTPDGCSVDADGCSRDEGDGSCDPGPRVPLCTDYYSAATGCPWDYDTRGWVNELGFTATVLAYFEEPRFGAVVAFLDHLEDHGTLPDKWGYWPSEPDPWAASASSVIRTSTVFWSLSTILRSRVNPLPVGRRDSPRLPPWRWGTPHAAHDVPDPIRVARTIGARTADSLVLVGASLERVCRESLPVELLARDTSSAAGRPASVGLPSDPDAPNPHRDAALPCCRGPAVRFELEVAGSVEAAVFDLSGRRIRGCRLDGLAPGHHEHHWDGRDEEGRGVAPGIYFLRVIGARKGLVVRRVMIAP